MCIRRRGRLTGWLASYVSVLLEEAEEREAGYCARRFWCWRLGVPGDRSCEGRIFDLQAARFEFPCRTAHPSVEPRRHEQTWARRSDLKPSAPQRLCIHVRFRGTALIQSTGLAQTGATTDRPPPLPGAPSTTHHPRLPSSISQFESRGTHARFVHTCTLEPSSRGLARGDVPMNYLYCFNVMSPHWTSKVNPEADPRRVPYVDKTGIGQPAHAGLLRSVDWRDMSLSPC